MSKAASKNRLEELHDLLATKMKDILENGEVVTDREGNALRVTPTAATLSAVRQFLKDNNIEAPVGGTKPLNDLQEATTKLPFGADPRDQTGGTIGRKNH
jgi:hypothetical protein